MKKICKMLVLPVGIVLGAIMGTLLAKQSEAFINTAFAIIMIVVVLVVGYVIVSDEENKQNPT